MKKLVALLLTASLIVMNCMVVFALPEEENMVQEEQTLGTESVVPDVEKETVENIDTVQAEETTIEDSVNPEQIDEQSNVTENVEENKEENVEQIENNEEQVENIENIEPTNQNEENTNIETDSVDEPMVENIETEESENTDTESATIEDYVGRNESELSDEFKQSDNVIINYVVDEDAEEGTILSQREEDGNIILEIATRPVEVENQLFKFNLLSSFELTSKMVEPPSMAESTWDDYPVSYEYNWDNSQSCWQWGEWKDGVCYKTEEGTYDNNVRHAMGMYCDGDNVHLHISFATIFYGPAHGDDYNFYIDGVGTKFRLLYADDGSNVTGQYRQPGTYDIVAVNGDSWNSEYEANGSYGTITIKENNVNNELEIVIPLETMQYQNPSVDVDNVMNIEFYTPNLMYRHISCGGASTGSSGFVVLTIVSFGMAFLVQRKKEYFRNLCVNFSFC